MRFGTDGIRGIYREGIDANLAFMAGRAVARAIGGEKVLVARDTRISGGELEAAVCAGIVGGGKHALTVGILPTPAVSFLTTALRCAAGIMITASHNPPEYNGIKIFGRDGLKLSADSERIVEYFIDNPPQRRAGGKKTTVMAADIYINHLVRATGRLDGLGIVCDCGYGAAYELAELFFRELGATVIAVNNCPNGKKINVGCGALFPEVAHSVLLHKNEVPSSFRKETKQADVSPAGIRSSQNNTDSLSENARYQNNKDTLSKNARCQNNTDALSENARYQNNTDALSENARYQNNKDSLSENARYQNNTDALSKNARYQNNKDTLSENARYQNNTDTLSGSVADIAFSFDGDADRLSVCDSAGVICGDSVLFNLAQMTGADTVVGTILANSALERRLSECGKRLLRTPVGDKHISELMKEKNYTLGGEQSGHYILRPHTVTGDALLTAGILARQIADGIRPERLTLVPQRSIAIDANPDKTDGEKIRKTMTAAEKMLNGKGRLVVRMSGTEPKLRIMAESDDERLVDAVLRLFSEALSE